VTLCCVSMARELAQPRLSRSLPAAVLAGSLQSRPMAFSAVSLGAKIAFEMRSGLTSELEPTLGLLELFTTGCSTFTMSAPERFSTLFNHYSRFKMQSGLVQWIGRLCRVCVRQGSRLARRQGANAASRALPGGLCFPGMAKSC